MDEDLQHLRLLSIFHYVVGGLAGLCACFPVIHLAVGIGMVTGSLDQKGSPPPPPAFGWMFIAMASAFIVAGWAFAIGMLVAGRMLARRKAYLFCMVMAGIATIFQPFGTVLGVFTIVVLLRPSVRDLFGRGESVSAGPGPSAA